MICKNKKFQILFLTAGIFLSSFPLFAQNDSFLNWNGYVQARFSANSDNVTEFSIRRAKLWAYGTIPKLSFISYKMQVEYTSYKTETFLFDDAYADIHTPHDGFLRVGRFLPDFMLQRTQPDYDIPVTERADVSSGMTINEKEDGREIGVQYTFEHATLPVHWSLGVYNANVEQAAHSKDNNLLLTSRLMYKILDKNSLNWSVGGSFSYRYLKNMTLTTIYNPDSVISGRDLRWGVESEFHWKNFELQGEYIQAIINNDLADGWYVQADYTFLKKYQLVAMLQKFNDLNPATSNNEWYGLGLNYQISGRTKLMADVKTRDTDSGRKYTGNVQLQIFFN